MRIHDDSRAHATASALHAKAFTHGTDIGLSDSRFSPRSGEGRRLLAHELAHVVQQRRGNGRAAPENRPALEGDAERAAGDVVQGAPRVTVAEASAPSVMLQPVDDYEAELRRERRETRQKNKKRTQEKERSRKSDRQRAREQADSKLRNMEERVYGEGGNQRSRARQTRELERFERWQRTASGTTLEKNTAKSGFHERQRSGSTVETQGEYVAGGKPTAGQEVTDKTGRRVASHTRPDISFRRGPDGMRVHVNLKSHQIHEMTPNKARGAVRDVLYQAVANKHHLPAGEPLVIEFEHVPDVEVQEAIKNELFRQNTPIDEVRFGNEPGQRAVDYPQEGRQPLDTDRKDRDRRLKREARAKKRADAERKKVGRASAKAEAARDAHGAALDKKAKAAEKKPGKAKKSTGKGKGGKAGKGKGKPESQGKSKTKGKAAGKTKGATSKAKAKQPTTTTKKAAAPEAKATAPEAKAPVESGKGAAPEAKATVEAKAPKAATVAPAEVRAPVTEPTVAKPAAPVSEPKASAPRGVASTALTAATALAVLPALRGIANKYREGNWVEATKDTAELGASFVPALAPVFFAKGMISEYWGENHEVIQEHANTVGDVFKEAAEYTPIGLIPYGPEIVGGLGAAASATVETAGRTVYHMGEAVYEGGEMVVEGIGAGAEAVYDFFTEGPSMMEMYEEMARRQAEED